MTQMTTGGTVKQLLLQTLNGSNTEDRNRGDARRPSNDTCPDRRGVSLPSASAVP